MKHIPLTKDKVAVVDDCDFAYLSQFSWQAHKGRHTYYACRQARRGTGKQATEQMHRVITAAPHNMDVDHWDGDGLNNQRYNLRLCSNLQNSCNKRKVAAASSVFKGVTWNKRLNKWVSQAQLAGAKMHLGVFETEKEAARAYDRAAVQHFGEFARLNFPANT